MVEKPSGIADDTTNSDSASGIAGDTSCGIADDTTSAPSGIAGDTKTDLREPAYKAELQVGGRIDTHDPLPAVGLAATAAVSRGPFERFWQGFPRKYQKPKARAAWDKLSPDSDLAERIIVAAAAWAAHYEANPVDKKWMPTPANWLAGERYDEDLPSVYADPKEAAIAKKKDRPAKATKKAAKLEPFTERRETFTIIDASVGDEGASKWLDIALQADDGVCDDMTICIESHDESAQQKGQNLLDRIVSATGLPAADDTSDLVGAKFVRVLRSKFAEFEYERVAVNDNRPFNDTVLVDDMPTPPKVRPPMPRFAEIVARTKFEGWASKIGTAYDDDDLDEAA